MRILNRTALVVRPKRRFVEWVNSLGVDGPPLSLDEARAAASIYLVRESDLDETSALISEYALEVFEEELCGWSNDKARWPRNRSAHVFRDWFDVERVQRVGDLEDAALDDDEIVIDEAVATALNHCAWCDRHLDEEDERIGLGLNHADPEALAGLEGQTLPVPLAGRTHVPVAIVATADSEAWAMGEPLLFTLCSTACARELKTAFERERDARSS